MVARAVQAVVVLVREGAEVARWPLTSDGAPDLALVDRIARLQLAARRNGCAIRLREVAPDLAGLLDLVGLSVQVGWQAEGGEEAGVDEVVVPDDPVA